MNWLPFPENIPPAGVPLWLTALHDAGHTAVGNGEFFPHTGFCDEFGPLEGDVIAFVVLPGPYVPKVAA